MFWSTWPPIKVILKNFLKKTDCSQRLLRKSDEVDFRKSRVYWNIIGIFRMWERNIGGASFKTMRNLGE